MHYITCNKQWPVRL